MIIYGLTYRARTKARRARARARARGMTHLE